jgi:hypothetical protein
MWQVLHPSSRGEEVGILRVGSPACVSASIVLALRSRCPNKMEKYEVMRSSDGRWYVV